MVGRAALVSVLVSASSVVAVAVASGALLRPPEEKAARVTGVVVDDAGPVAGATVRVQGRATSTRTDPSGLFQLRGLARGDDVTLSAWAEGRYCAKREGVRPPAEGVVLTLRRYQSGDNPAYRWVPPVGAGGCASCKPAVTQVWLERDAHARSASNIRFLTMYKGTDVHGNQSPPTRHSCSRDYGCVPLPPDPTRPYYGPGYKLDFPATSGNCAACHTPGAAVDRPYGTDPTRVEDADRYGVHCDFCHKVAGVRLDPGSGLPFPNHPGVLSMDIRRPFPDDPERTQLFFGTFDDDNVPAEDTRLPLLAESRYCAPCHSATFWGVTIYNSFGEWLSSPYSDPEYPGAMTCQQCHMPSPTIVDGVALTNVAPGNGGIERAPDTIHAHTFPGASSVELLRNAVTLEADCRLDEGQLSVQVRVTNDRTGHHVPTDSPLRHLILLVRATGLRDEPLVQLAGPRVPAWGGVGDPDRGYYAGLPGKAFAKVLRELGTAVSPSGAYWNPTVLVSDNRLAAFASDVSDYAFVAPLGGRIQVRVTLLFRRAFRALADLKQWNDPDIVMAEWATVLPPGRWPTGGECPESVIRRQRR